MSQAKLVEQEKREELQLLNGSCEEQLLLRTKDTLSMYLKNESNS